MAFGALVQLVKDTDNTDPNTVVYGSNVTAGNLLIAAFSTVDGITLVPTDSQGNTWQLAVSEDVPAFVAKLHMYFTVPGTSGANTVTFSGAASAVIFIGEYEGPFAPAPFDPGTGQGASGVSTTADSGAFTPSHDGHLCLGFFIAGADLTVAGGWTADNDSTIPAGFTMMSRLVQTTAASTSAQATLASAGWLAIGAAFRKRIIMPANGGTYTVTGTAAGVRATRKVTAVGGSYALTGTAATLRLARRITAVGGSYSITGTAAGLRATRRMTAVGGSYVLTGTAADLRKGFILIAASGAYTLTGTAAGLRATRKIAAGSGAYVLTGSAANLLANRRIAAVGGVYALSGTAATLRAARRIIAGGGTYLVTGTAAELIFVSQIGEALYVFRAGPRIWVPVAVIREWEHEIDARRVTLTAPSRRYSFPAEPIRKVS